MRVLFYRDKKATDEIQITTVTRDRGVVIEAPYRIQEGWNWELDWYTTKTNESFRPIRIYNNQ
jgi:hypothetical protein